MNREALSAVKRFEKLGKLPKRPWRELPPAAQEMYLAAYRRTWEKCHAGGIQNRDELAKTAHEAAVLAVEGEFEFDEVARDIQSPISAGDDRPHLRARRSHED